MAEAGDFTQQPASDWREPLKADPEIAPHIEKISEKDLPTFVKSHLNLTKKLGDTENRVREELKAKGLLKQPAPERYEIKRPDNLPEGAWNEQLEAKAQEWGKKHGLSQEAVSEALNLYLESFAGFAEPIMRDREASEKALIDRAAKAGVPIEQLQEGFKRWVDQHVADEATREKMARAGLADDPDLIWMFYEAAAASGQFDTRNDKDSTMDALVSADEQAVLDLMAVLNNPNHPDYSKYNTAENNAKIDAYWQKKAGGQQFVIS